MFPYAIPPIIVRNNIEAEPAPIGGLGVVGDGGYIVVTWNTVPGNSRPFYQHALLDVIRWRLASGFGEQPIAKGGMLGATSSRRTGYTHVWEAEVLLDLRIQPRIVLGRPLQTELLFRVGTHSVEGQTVSPRYYWLPRAHLDNSSPAVEAGAKLRVRQHVAGCANSHLFLLPDDGIPGDVNTLAGAYQAWLSGPGANQ
jgi:hypothetical protein